MKKILPILLVLLSTVAYSQNSRYAIWNDDPTNVNGLSGFYSYTDDDTLDLTAKVKGVLPFINGGISGSANAPATSGTMSITMTSAIISITPTGACTFNASTGRAGYRVTFVITTSGTTSRVLTWGTNFRAVSTLATGTTNNKIFCVSFLCIGANTWVETGRTAAM